jgi:carboxyl-terminal processing protease
MQRPFLRMALALCLGLGMLPWSSPAEAQARLSKAATVSVPQDVLRRGAELEAGRRWGEALTHYEDALRDFPADPSLTQRLELARIHYGIVRRYNDASFKRSLANMDLEEVMALYDEVVLKVQSHYVHDLDWAQLVAEGTRGVQVAMANETFVAEHLRVTPTDRIEAFSQDLPRQVNSRVVNDRKSAEDAVRAAAQLAERQLRIPAAAVVMEYVQRAATSLDEYSTYLTADQLNDLYSQIDGNFVGLGVELQGDRGALVIMKVIAGSPAEKGGLKAQDRIVAINGATVEGMTTEKAAGLLQGTEGSQVEVSLQSPGEAVRRVRLRRQQVEVPSIDQVKIVEAKTGVAFLRLSSFQKTTPKELDDALWKLHREGMRSLIIDLRGNPGGLLTTSVEVADRFLASGRIVSTRGRSPDQNWTYSAHQPGTWRVPLVVLIDRDSASASEIFAGAIRDHQRGTIVGQNSYGKGSVQSIFSLNRQNSGLRLTTAKFYSPLGHPYSKVGVAPHVTVQQAAKPVNGGLKLLNTQEDPVMTEAIRVARELPPVQ